MRMVGVLLVSAMIVIPALTGFALGRSFHTATAIAIGIALLSMTSGLIAAYYLRLAAGGAVVLAALLIFAAASLARRRWPRPAGGPAMIRSRVGILAALLLVLAVPAAIAQGPAKGSAPNPAQKPAQNPAQNPECPRWREAFAAMPVRACDRQRGARPLHPSAGRRHLRAAGRRLSVRDPREIQGHLILFDFGREILTQFHMQNVPAAARHCLRQGRRPHLRHLEDGAEPHRALRPLGSFRYALEARRVLREPGHPPGEARLVLPPAR